jgi:hypothetical protein
MIEDGALRDAALRAFFAAQAADPIDLGPDGPILAPDIRHAALARFAAQSATWAAARGYAPDPAALAATTPSDPPPAPDLPAPLVARLVEARLRAEPVAGGPPAPRALPELRGGDPALLTIRLKPRPWLARLIARAKQR